MPWWPGDAGPAGSAWRQGPHRLNAGWQFELRAPADALQLAPLTRAAARRQRAGAPARLDAGRRARCKAVTLGYAARPAAHPGRLRAELLLAGNRVQLEPGRPTGNGRRRRWQAQIEPPTGDAGAPWTRLHADLAPWVPKRGAIDAGS
ncbi:MAG: hypothetical protein U1F25_00525 [Rubrivivax sp.]